MLTSERTLWGIHMPVEFGQQPIAEGFVAIGWPDMGNLAALPNDREAFKRLLVQSYPSTKPGAVATTAGMLFRIAKAMREGDLVIYPSKADRMVNAGVVLGDYRYLEGDEYPHRRAISWKAHVARAVLPQAALNEIGSALTLFQIVNNPDPFLQTLSGTPPSVVEAAENEEAITEAAAGDAIEETEDFVIRRLLTRIGPYEFEEFIAALLRAMGYHAEATRRSGDGGFDVLAHRDRLGFEPPVIKVQCKQTLAPRGAPEVQQLLGTLDATEFGMFVTLGGFTAQARDIERKRANLRLVDGEALCKLVFAHYDRFEPRWQAVVPLKLRYLPGDV